MFQPSSVVRLGNGAETPALLMFVAYFTSQIFIMELTALIYLTKHMPAVAFTNVWGLFCMWNLVDFYNTRLTLNLRLRVSDVSATESSQKLWHDREATGVLQDGWYIYFQWHSFWPQTEKKESHFDYNAEDDNAEQWV